ncbi:tetratricopeptide repeat protein [Candidatus Poribacteria bacterium]|nr:tetratricopeptide repeat protein [Candidatus Poribacteria bacterium]
MEPFTITGLLIGSALFGGNVAGAVISGILGNRAYDFCCQAYATIAERLKKGGKPINHDLQRAVQGAYWHALRIICEECLKQSPKGSLLRPPPPETRWLEQKLKAVKEQIQQLEKAEYIEASVQAISEVELLLQPTGEFARQRLGVLQERLIDELVKEAGAPELYQEKVYSDFFSLMSAFFCNEIKHNEAVYNLFSAQLLSHIDLNVAAQQANQPVDLQTMMSEMQGTLQRTAEAVPLVKEWFVRTDEQLTQIRQELGAGFGQMGVQFDEVMRLLSEGQFPQLLEEVRALRQEAQEEAKQLKQFMEDLYVKAQRVDEKQFRQLKSDIEEILRKSIEEGQRRRELTRERVIGPIPGAIAEHFKDRDIEMRTLKESLAAENARLVLVCGRGGMGKTALVTKLLKEIQTEFVLRLNSTTLNVDGILYVSLRQSDVHSIDQIYANVGRMLGSPHAEELHEKWMEQTSLADKLEFLFRKLRTGLTLIVLDNFEDALDDENRIKSEYADVSLFVEKCLEFDHSARLVVTSRRTLMLPQGIHYDRMAEVPLDIGLPETDAIALLRDLDMDGRLRLKDAPDELLRDVVRNAHRIPRTLETLVGVLCQRPTLSLSKFLENAAAFNALVENPAKELYDSLTPDARLVMQALAIYARPVPLAGVRFLLPALPVDELLDSLVLNHAVSYDRAHEAFELHPLDEKYAYAQIPEGDGEYTRVALHRKAAEFYRQLRKPQEEWKTIDDLEPQLQEFHHLVRAGLYDEACSLLNDIDFDYLSLWGYSALIVELRSQITDYLTDAYLEQSNWCDLGLAYHDLRETRRAIECYERSLAIARQENAKGGIAHAVGCLGNAYANLGETRKAIEFYEQALQIAKEIGDRWNEGVCLGNLGVTYYALGETRKAIEYYEQALQIAKEIGDRRGEGNRLGNLGIAYHQLGETRKAIEFYNQALQIFKEKGDRFDESIALFNIGEAHHHLGNLAEAHRYYEEAFALDIPSTNYSCAVKLGILCLEEGKAEEARDHFVRGITLCRVLLENTPRLYDALYHLALAQLGNGQSDDALATYRQALEVCSAKGVVQNALQDLRLLGRAPLAVAGLDEAVAILERADC